MDLANEEKIAFIIKGRTFFYRMMPFGLKNVGAIYQCLIDRMFKDQIGRNMEVYVDDMLVKSGRAQDYFVNLEETLQKLRRHDLKLNPDKCAFGIRFGKFLEFMISNQGIEANPEKVLAIQEMQLQQQFGKYNASTVVLPS